MGGGWGQRRTGEWIEVEVRYCGGLWVYCLRREEDCMGMNIVWVEGCQGNVVKRVGKGRPRGIITEVPCWRGSSGTQESLLTAVM